MSTETGLTMREMSLRSGVSEATLRMWENRHGFPRPERLPSGHRRYSEADLERVLAVVRAREQGLSLPTAIDRASRTAGGPPSSVFATVTERNPHLQPQVLPKRALLHISHAIEDESAVRGERPLLIGCFQQERFYRASEARWRELARTAEHAVVLAAFTSSRRSPGRPTEVALGGGEPLLREWAVVCHAPQFAACMIGSERPGSPREFETIWTVEPAIVGEAARALCELASHTEPEIAADLVSWLRDAPPATGDVVRNAIALSSRIVRYATA